MFGSWGRFIEKGTCVTLTNYPMFAIRSNTANDILINISNLLNHSKITKSGFICYLHSKYMKLKKNFFLAFFLM